MSQAPAVTTQLVPASTPAANSIPALAPGIQTLLLPGTGIDGATRTVVVSAGAGPAASASGGPGPALSSEALSVGIQSTALDSISPFLSTLSTATLSSSVSSTSTNTPDASGSGNGSSTNIGAIVGGVVGGLAVIGIVVVAMYWIKRRHPKQKNIEPHVEEPKPHEPTEWRADATLAEMDQGNARPTPELDARWNQINEMPAVKK